MDISKINPIAGGARRKVLWLFTAYFGYLLLLGPFWALDGRGLLGDISERARFVLWSPAFVWRTVPLAGRVLDAYFDWWYIDPAASEMAE